MPGMRGRAWVRRRAAAAGRRAVLSVAFQFAAGMSAQQADTPLDYDAALAQSGVEGSYGYVRAIEGSATLVQSDTGERVRVVANEPVLGLDRLFVSDGSRVEILLADGNVVRVGSQTELSFQALANSGDTDDPATVLELVRGTVQLVASTGLPDIDFPSVVAVGATIRPQAAGSLLVIADGRHLEVIARESAVEVFTESQIAEIRRGERLSARGPRGDNLDFSDAPGLDRLEAWGLGLRSTDGEYVDYVDPSLRYAASSLRGQGSWVQVSGGHAWRPHVKRGWAPYRHGRWRHTPSGLFWVSFEPWGWVPYHYGYWDDHPNWGWIWHPGRHFAAAHVFWYWGPKYAGWIPSGYYWRHYRNRYGDRWGFHFGVYGYIGGNAGLYEHWTFLPHGRLGGRRQHFYALSGADFARRGRAVERGLLLTDTRTIRPETWRNPEETLAGLRRAVLRDGREIGDATAFVERRPRLPGELVRVASGRDGRQAGADADGAKLGGTGQGGRSAVRRPATAGDAGNPLAPDKVREAVERQPRLPGELVRVAPGGDGRTTGAVRRPSGAGIQRPSPTGGRQRSAVRRPATGLDSGGTPSRERAREVVERQRGSGPGGAVHRPTGTGIQRPNPTGDRQRSAVRRPATVQGAGNPSARDRAKDAIGRQRGSGPGGAVRRPTGTGIQRSNPTGDRQRSAVRRPAVSRPTASWPQAITRPALGRPGTSPRQTWQPFVTRPAVRQPGARQPASQSPWARQPALRQPTGRQPVGRSATARRPSGATAGSPARPSTRRTATRSARPRNP